VHVVADVANIQRRRERHLAGARVSTEEAQQRERPCRSQVVREARAACVHGSGAACRDLYESGVKKGGVLEGWDGTAAQ
jgi:hypothetical protein